MFFPALLLACGSLTHIEIEQSAQTTVEGGTLLEDLLGDIGFEGFVSMDISESSELKNQGVEPGDIEDTRLLSLELEALEGSDLSFFEEMAFFVEADGLPRERVAYLDSFPDGDRLVDFDVEDIDLTDYATSDAMTLTTEVTASRPDEDTVVEARLLLDVGVTAQGVFNQARGE